MKFQVSPMNTPIKEGVGHGRNEFSFTLLLDGWDYVREVTTRYSEFGEVEEFGEGNLEPKSALLY